MGLFGYGKYKPVIQLAEFLGRYRIPADVEYLSNQTPYVTTTVRDGVEARVVLLGGMEWAVSYAVYLPGGRLPQVGPQQTLGAVGISFEELMREVTRRAPYAVDPECPELGLGEALTSRYPEVKWRLAGSTHPDAQPDDVVLYADLGGGMVASVTSAGGQWRIAYYEDASGNLIRERFAGLRGQTSPTAVARTVVENRPPR